MGVLGVYLSMTKLTLVVLAAVLFSGCAAIRAKHEREDAVQQAAINALTPEQRQQLLYEMLKNQYATPPPQAVYRPVYTPPAQPTQTYCYPSGGYIYCNSY